MANGICRPICKKLVFKDDICGGKLLLWLFFVLVARGACLFFVSHVTSLSFFLLPLPPPSLPLIQDDHHWFLTNWGLRCRVSTVWLAAVDEKSLEFA